MKWNELLNGPGPTQSICIYISLYRQLSSAQLGQFEISINDSSHLGLALPCEGCVFIFRLSKQTNCCAYYQLLDATWCY